MYSRTGINDMLAELASDMPRLLRNRDTFFREYDARSSRILSATSPDDKAYVLGVLQAFADRCGINDLLQDRHAA